MNNAKVCTILALSPIALIILNAYEIIPKRFAPYLVMCLFFIASASCIALKICPKEARWIGAVPAVLLILTSLLEFHEYMKFDKGSFGSMTRTFYSFICGVWYFALLVNTHEK